MKLVLTRMAYLKEGTFGYLEFPDGTILHTVEKPWKDNVQRESCIPEGRYKMGVRTSGVVSRTTKGKYRQGWEIQNVVNRTYIMFHIANWPTDVVGCVGVGMSTQVISGKMAVGSSAIAFDLFMEKLKREKDVEIVIRGFNIN